jgi:hypothetical protein
MSEISDQVRTLVGQGKYQEAIDLLVRDLKSISTELYNQAIHIRGQYSAYHKNVLRGTGDQAETRNKISWAVLDLATQLENFKEKEPADQPQANNTGDDPNTHHSPQPTQPATYKAQCFFNGDAMQYFITPQNQIICMNPMTNQSFMVGMKMPSQDFRYAWTYYIQANGMYYMVDHAGVIWGQNFGMPAQMGHVKYF